MSIPEEKQPFVGDCTVSPTHAATLMAQEGGDGCMGSRSMTVGRYEEIRRRLGEGPRASRDRPGTGVFTLHSAGGPRLCAVHKYAESAAASARCVRWSGTSQSA